MRRCIIMSLKEWFRARKERREARRRQKVERAIVSEDGELRAQKPINAEKLQGLDFNEADIVPPESRFTEEYGEFLKKQEAAEANIVRNSEEITPD